MSINFPTSLDSLTNPSASDLLENATAALDHDVQHSNANDAIEALETKVGANSSAVTTSHDYKLSLVTGTDKAVSATSSSILTNKTLSTGTKINITGGDTTGSIYYKNASDVLTALAPGADGNILSISGGLPTMIANPAAANSSLIVKGVVELATTAEINAGTATGATGAALVVTPDALLTSNYLDTSDIGSTANKIVALDGSAKLPAYDGSQLTNMVAQHKGLFKNGTADKSITDESVVQNIAHGLGIIPKKVKIVATYQTTGAAGMNQAITVYNGTTQSSNYTCGTAGAGSNFGGTTFTLTTTAGPYQIGVVTFDATNIIITWTKSGSPSAATFNLLWEAEA